MRPADDLKKKKKSFGIAEFKTYGEGLQKELMILSD